MNAHKKTDDVWQPLKMGFFSFHQVAAAIIAWLVLYAVGSVFVSNPFWTESRAGADINYAHIMYLHGLLIALAGMSALLVCQVFSIRTPFVRSSILAAVVGAIALSTLGGILDASIPMELWRKFWLYIFTFQVSLLSIIFSSLS